MRIVVYRGKDRDWYLRIVALNGEIVLDSEGYATKSNALRAARKWQRRLLAPTITRIEVEA